MAAGCYETTTVIEKLRRIFGIRIILKFDVTVYCRPRWHNWSRLLFSELRNRRLLRARRTNWYVKWTRNSTEWTVCRLNVGFSTTFMSPQVSSGLRQTANQWHVVSVSNKGPRSKSGKDDKRRPARNLGFEKKTLAN